MERQHFKPGELILKQGDLGNRAYRILKGKVEIFFTRGTHRIFLGQLGDGEIFGEMGMIEDKPRSASVRVLEDTEVEILAPHDFNEFILKNPNALVPYLKSFFERLRHTNELSSRALLSTLQSSENNAQGISALETGIVQMIPLTEILRERIERESILIRKFPFRIGRWSENSQTDVFVSNDLLIRDDTPYQISRNHCAIEREGHRFSILDRGSAHGTQVNGKRIGGSESQAMVAILQKGRNEIVLGKNESPYRFDLVIT